MISATQLGFLRFARFSTRTTTTNLTMVAVAVAVVLLLRMLRLYLRMGCVQRFQEGTHRFRFLYFILLHQIFFTTSGVYSVIVILQNKKTKFEFSSFYHLTVFCFCFCFCFCSFVFILVFFCSFGFLVY